MIGPPEDGVDGRAHGKPEGDSDGGRHIDALADEWSTRIAVPRETIRTYLSKNIWYTLDEPCLAGLDLFYRYGVECGALPLAPRLRFL